MPNVTSGQPLRAARFYLLTAGLAVGFVVFWFGPLLVGSGQLGFRDAANFYVPAFQWQREEWAEGRIPLWNPLSGTGQPELAQTTSSVLYPGKLLFLLPISTGYAYTLYVVLHLLLAVAAATIAARGSGNHPAAAALAGLAYGFCGGVLFQSYNVVFLVGAAWLPLGLLAAQRTVLGPSSWRAPIGLAVVLAMMTLGGDPQVALHCLLCAGLLWCFWIRDQAPGSRRGVGLRSGKRLVAAGALAALLAAVQIWPAWEWSRQSERTVYGAPRNLYEWLLETVHREPNEDLFPPSEIFGGPAAGTHHRHVYNFSQPPWELAGLAWPNVCGRLFPSNERWTADTARRDRVWVPSYYLGIVPLCLALATLRRGGGLRHRWLVWSAMLFTLGSFGWYGLSWLLSGFHNASFVPGTEHRIAAPVGGVYWACVTLIPGYVMFRYPAKLMLVACLQISLLAADGWHRDLERQDRRVSQALGAAAAVSLLGVLCWWVARGWFFARAADVAPDPVFGPLDAEAAYRNIGLSLLHSILVLGVASAWRYWQSGATQQVGLILLLAIDLGIAHRPLIGRVPLQQTPLPAVDFARARSLPRTTREVPLPTEWSRHSERTRLLDVVRWERATHHPRYHLNTQLPLANAMGTMQSRDIGALLRLQQQWPRQADSLDYLSVQHELRIDRTANDATSGITSVPRPEGLPRAWLVRQIQVLPPLESNRQAALERRTRELFGRQESRFDLRKEAVYEGESRQMDLPTGGERNSEPAVSACPIIRSEPQLVEVEVICSKPSLLVLNDLFYPGWQARVHSSSGIEYRTKILPVNRFMRGVVLPPGQHWVTFIYRPRSFWWGLALSGMGWAIVLGSFVIPKIRTAD